MTTSHGIPTTEINHIYLRDQQNRAYTEFRKHTYEAWSEHCFTCDAPAPCQLHDTWLNRLQELEDLEQRLDTD